MTGCTPRRGPHTTPCTRLPPGASSRPRYGPGRAAVTGASSRRGSSWPIMSNRWTNGRTWPSNARTSCRRACPATPAEAGTRSCPTSHHTRLRSLVWCEVGQLRVPASAGVAGHARRHEVRAFEGQVRPLVQRFDMIGHELPRRLEAPVTAARPGPYLGRELAPGGSLVQGVVCGPRLGVQPVIGALAGRTARAGRDKLPAAAEA